MRTAIASEFAALLLFIAASVAWAGDPSPSTSTAPAAASTDEIRRSIRDLNHPALARRRAAVRRLAEWGPQTFEELRKAARDPNLELALSARDLLGELESAIFLGARVRLELSRTEIDWDEPFALTVVAANPTPGPLRVPWPAPATQPASRPAVTDAQQVAAMMDAADFLDVTGPDGEPLDLRVEPIERDPSVYAAVDQRARAQAPSHQIEPGRTARLTIPLFNRGWARYPMLHPGTYRVAFSYQPRWKDESWTQDGFGRVGAAPVSITVKTAAPPNVLQTEAPLELRLERSGDTIQAVFVSHWDLPVWVNVNLGGPAATHARLEWQLIPTRVDDAEPVDIAGSNTSPDFQIKAVHRLDAGERLVAGSLPIAEIRRHVAEQVDRRPARYALQARYVQLSTPDQVREELARLGKTDPIPTHLYTGAAISEELDTAGFLKD